MTIDFNKIVLSTLAPIKRPLYVVHTEGQKLPLHISEAPDDTIRGTYEQPLPGTAIYVVNEDGTLKLLDSNYESNELPI